VLINVTGGPDLMLFEVDEAVNRIRAEVDGDANILFGSALLEGMEGRVRVSVVATGIEAESMMRFNRDNVHRLDARRKPIEIDTGAARSAEPVATSPVHSQVENLAQGLGVASLASDDALESDLPLSAVESQILGDEPMDLGGADAPILDSPAYPEPTLHDFAPGRARPEKKRMFGLFGRKRDSEARHDPAMPVAPRTQAQPAARTQAVAQQPQRPAQPAQPAAEQVSPRAAAEAMRQRQHAPSDDLFADVAEEDRFEIPAFLRRQANTGT
jgi:cell division protein FtsZ